VQSFGAHQRKRFTELDERLEIFPLSPGQLALRVSINQLLQAAIGPRGQSQPAN
jgi:hypothetical protein